MPTTVTRLTLAAAAGLIALTACSAGGAVSPAQSSAPRGTTTAAASASDLATAPLGEQTLALRSLTRSGAAVEVPDGTTLAVSPDATAFQATVSGICGQPRWGVAVAVPAARRSSTSITSGPPRSARSVSTAPAVSSAATGRVSRAKTGPVSRPSSSWNTSAAISVSPAITARWTGAAPR